METADGRRARPHAAVVTLVSVAATALAFVVLRAVTRSAGGDPQLAGSPEFATWTVVAAVTVVVFLDSVATGLLALSGHATDAPAGAGLSARLQRFDSAAVATLRSRLAGSWLYAVLYVVFALLAVVVLRLVGHGGPDVPVHGWPVLTLVLLGLGALAACPWVIVVWSTHDDLTAARDTVGTLPTIAAPEAASADDVTAVDARLSELIEQRRVIGLAVTRLLVLVLAAMLLSGTLRVALVARFPSGDPLPAVDVLLYGAFFAVVLGLAVIPLLRSWRATALDLVDHVFPASVTATADADAARARLVTRLDLDGSLFRSPIALSSVLAPLVTSLLAVYLPQAAG